MGVAKGFWGMLGHGMLMYCLLHSYPRVAKGRGGAKATYRRVHHDKVKGCLFEVSSKNAKYLPKGSVAIRLLCQGLPVIVSVSRQPGERDNLAAAVAPIASALLPPPQMLQHMNALGLPIIYVMLNSYDAI